MLFQIIIKPLRLCGRNQESNYIKMLNEERFGCICPRNCNRNTMGFNDEKKDFIVDEKKALIV